MSYVLAQCTGHEFLKHAQTHWLPGLTVKGILGNAWDEMAKAGPVNAGMFFNANYQPQQCHRNAGAYIHTKEDFLNNATLKKTFSIAPKPSFVSLKTAEGQWKHKRDVMINIKRLRGNGAFNAKNQWQIWNLGRKQKFPTDFEYSEAGPGARAFLLLSGGFPQRLLLHSSSQDAADFFATLLRERIDK